MSENRWVEVSVVADQSSIDDLVGFLQRQCAGGATVEQLPVGDTGGLAPHATVKGYLPEWDEETRRKLEIALLLLSRSSPISEPLFRTLEPNDWSESWKAFFPPLPIGERIVIVPTWREYPAEGSGDEVNSDRIIIRLDPGMAFGTGLHATTRLCLIALERMVTPGVRVLDVGTGSGVLAISAALQGAGHIDAIDADRVAVEVAAENVVLNGVHDLVTVGHGSLGEKRPMGVPLHTGSGYELLLVNILAEIIIDMAVALGEALGYGGRYVASGIISQKADDVVAALEQAGLSIDERLVEDDWVALVGHKD